MKYLLNLALIIAFITACAPSDQELFEAGVEQIEASNYKQAIEYFERAIEQNPENTAAYNAKGVAYFNLEDYDQAISSFNTSIQIDSTSYKPFFNRGNAYLEKGEFTKAIIDYNYANGMDPQQMDVYYNRGVALLSMEEYEDAILDFEMVLQANPNHSQANFYKGKAELGNNMPLAALESLERATNLDNRNGAAFYLLGVTELSALGKKEEGCANLKTALSLGYTDAKEWVDEFCQD